MVQHVVHIEIEEIENYNKGCEKELKYIKNTI